MEQFDVINRIDSLASKQSLHEDLLSTSTLGQLNHNENIGILFVFSANFVWTFNAFLTKLIQTTYHDYYETNVFLFIRTIMIISLALFFAYISNEHILTFSEINHKLAFFTRTSLTYFSVSFYTMSMWYLRVSTTQIITLLCPIMVIMLSSLILKEPFYTRYIYGLFFCLGGSFIILSNEKKAGSSHNNTTNDNTALFSVATLIGITFGLLSNCTGAFISIANKILAVNKVPVNTQMCYVSLCTFICTITGIIYTWSFKFCFGYVCLCFLHGCVFYLGQYLYNQGIQKIDLNKATMISYFKIIWVFLLGGIFLKEPIFLTDIIGAALIVTYQLYNIYYPVISIK